MALAVRATVVINQMQNITESSKKHLFEHMNFFVIFKLQLLCLHQTSSTFFVCTGYMYTFLHVQTDNKLKADDLKMLYLIFFFLNAKILQFHVEYFAFVIFLKK